jgi:putative hydrolase of the HAD superfamily
MVGKPIPEILVETVKVLNQKPSDAVLVGDNPNSDIAGGNAAGLTTVLVKRNPDDIVAYESGDMNTTPSVTVDSLDELVSQI